MTLYLLIHTPRIGEEEAIAKPTDMAGLARSSADPQARAQWLNTWSPASTDDRIFTLWESDDPESIAKAMQRFGFLDTMDAEFLPVQSWSSASVIETMTDEPAVEQEGE